MNPRKLVALALLAGASAGAGLTVLCMPERVVARAEVVAPASSMPEAIKAAAQATPVVATAAEKEANRGPSEEYVRLAQALVALDERMAGIEERNTGSQTKVEQLLEDVRQLALQLEIRSGQLRPMRAGQAGERLEPLQGRPAAAGPARDRPGVTEDGLPQW